MNQWALMLAALPATHQRLIARACRVSLPRSCSADERIRRLRRALCSAATVHATYAMLDARERAVLQELRGARYGQPLAQLQACYGALRSLRQLAADPRPQSVLERLALIGWLLPGKGTAVAEPRWRLPAELRRWLPQPLVLPDLGLAPEPADPPALRVARTLLLTCAEAPLALRLDGGLRRSATRRLCSRLSAVTADAPDELMSFLLPILRSLDLVSVDRQICRLTPAGQRFLSLDAATQRERLTEAWVVRPQPDRWTKELRRNTAGIDWPVLRRRLLAWAGALPAGRLLDAEALFPPLSAALGPLADAHTHGFRTISRTPWEPRRAAAVFVAALHRPLAWLGAVAWTAPTSSGGTLVFRPAAASVSAPQPWRLDEAGLVAVPHVSADADILRLLPFARWHAASSDAATFEISSASLTRAVGAGQRVDLLRALLERRAGPLPVTWKALLAAEPPHLRLIRADVLVADQPQHLARAARSGRVRRTLEAQLAPGVALVAPGRAAALSDALARQSVAIERSDQTPPATPPAGLTAGECAALLAAVSFCREHALGLSQPISDDLEHRLRAALKPEQRRALDVPAPTALLAAAVESPLTLADALATLRAAVAGRGALKIAYDAAGGGTPAWRRVRPLAIERHGDVWLLRAYCAERRAERTFRADRILGVWRE